MRKKLTEIAETLSATYNFDSEILIIKLDEETLFNDQMGHEDDWNTIQIEDELFDINLWRNDKEDFNIALTLYPLVGIEKKDGEDTEFLATNTDYFARIKLEEITNEDIQPFYQIYQLKITCPECKSDNIHERSGYQVCFTCGHMFNK